MHSRIWVRGRLQSDPVQMDGDDITVVGFVVENEQTAPGSREQRISQMVPWCDVSCVGALASNVLGSLAEGDHVIVHGELHVHRLHPLDDARESAMISVRAESVGLDLEYGVARFRRAVRAAGLKSTLHLVETA